MRDIDQGWAWVVMMAAFCTQFITGVLSYSVGVFHNALLNEFKEDLTFTSLVGSVYTSLLCLTGSYVKSRERERERRINGREINKQKNKLTHKYRVEREMKTNTRF